VKKGVNLSRRLAGALPVRVENKAYCLGEGSKIRRRTSLSKKKGE